MKVLIVHPNEGIKGGAEEVIAQLIKYLTDNKHEVLFVYEKRSYGLWKEAHTLLEWADVINVHNFPATLAPFPTKKPIVWMCNEPAELFTNWWRKPIEAFNRWWVKKSGMKVVVADQANAYRFFNIYGVVPKAIIPYGVDYDFWSQGERIEGDGKIRLLQVGTISPYKNQLASILALIELLENGIDAELTLAGSVTDERYHRSLISNMNYAEHVGIKGFIPKVTFIGQKSREEVRDLFNCHDVLLHPVKEQGGWLVPFEAICAGLPVIVSQEFTGADIIRDNNLGIVTNDYANVIKHGVVGYQQPWDEITEEAGKWVKENLGWERFGEGMLEVFEEAIEK